MTHEELQAALDQANANVELLSAELSNQAEQFAAWRGAMSQVAILAYGANNFLPTRRLGKIQEQVEAICGI